MSTRRIIDQIAYFLGIGASGDVPLFVVVESRNPVFVAHFWLEDHAAARALSVRARDIRP